MPKEKNTLETPENRFLDLECIDDFQIDETNNALVSANSQEAKNILDEILSDTKVKGEIRKKMLKAVKLLENED